MAPSGTGTDSDPFPVVDSNALPSPRSTSSIGSRGSAGNRPAASSSLSGRLRRASLSFEQSDVPEGFLAATGGIASSLLTRQAAPRPGNVANPVASAAAQPSVVNDHVLRRTPPVVDPVPEEPKTDMNQESRDGISASADSTGSATKPPPAAAPFANGYHFPPKHSFGQSTKLGLLGFWNYFLTPLGFLVVLYGLNVVAWGGMLFLLLCNASPAMCHPTCDDINSPRRKWVEWDSQILNALFCVTGFGLAPWRFRDLYFLLQYRVRKQEIALRKLAAIHRGWFRLHGSTELAPGIGPGNVQEALLAAESMTIPHPENKIPDAPLTGVRARATKLWKMDLVIWLMVWNTFLQCVLSGFMWGLNRYDRPSWSTGLFVALACIVAAIGGIIMFVEGKKVKSIEGVPISEADRERLQRDKEQGIFHYNNIKDKDLEQKTAEKEQKKVDKEHKKELKDSKHDKK